MIPRGWFTSSVTGGRFKHKKAQKNEGKMFKSFKKFHNSETKIVAVEMRWLSVGVMKEHREN
jgi:hypothetical protein